MINKKFFTIILCTLLIAGCWDRRELNDLGFVLATGMDKGSNGKIVLTVQVVRPSALQKGGGGGQQLPVEIVSTTGSTVFQAIRNISKEFDKEVSFFHNKVIVIDGQLARDGVLPILDFWPRSYELRPTNWLIIAKDSKAREILGEKHGIENIQATYLSSIIKRKSLNSEVSTPNLLDFLKAVGGSGINPIGGAMEIIQESALPVELGQQQEETKKVVVKGVKLTGTAVFKKDKLVGYLNDIETRGYNWVTGKVQSGVINVPSPTDKNKLIAIEITRANSKIKPQVKDGNISFTIEVKEEGDIAEQQSLTDTSKLPVFEEIERAQKKVIKKEVEMAVDKVQQKFGSDIFGFGVALNDKYPDVWKEVKESWEDKFPKVKYTVEVETSLKKTGMLQKPLVEKKKVPVTEFESRDRSKNILKK